MRILSLVFLFALSMGLAACGPGSPQLAPQLAPALAPLETATPLPSTGTPTPTRVWFPPTATATPLAFPTMPVTPTVDARPVMGELILEDDFSDPEQWTLGRGPAGSAAFSKNELTLAVSKPRGYLYSLRPGTQLRNFYLEINASPSICRSEDEYGLLLRVSASLDFYRFSLTCDGQVRFDRVVNGVASSRQPLTPSGAVPRGAPSLSRLGVSAVGKELRFFVNGEFLFSVRDPSLTSGGLGVFARAAGEDVVTVNFSDLVIYQAQ